MGYTIEIDNDNEAAEKLTFYSQNVTAGTKLKYRGYTLEKRGDSELLVFDENYMPQMNDSESVERITPVAYDSEEAFINYLDELIDE